jgi:membrane fusion protein (multidrug efflux system)
VKKGISIIVSAVILICFIAVISHEKFGSDHKIAKDKSKPFVSTMTISKSRINTSLKSIGTAVSRESVDIMSNVTQKVVSIHFSDCEYVKQGQLLVQLNTDKKTAEKKQAEINLLEQQRELNRLETLKKKKVVSEKDYDTQKTKLLSAQAKLDEINAELKESSIIAPFDGVLGIRKISVGALLTPGSVIATIDDIDKLNIDFTIPEKYSPLLEPNLKITAKSIAFADKKFEGNILAVVPRLSTISRSISVRGVIDNKEHLLKPGMMLKISIKLKDREIIRVPEKAVLSIGEKHYVFLLNNESKVVNRQYVTIGQREDMFVEIQKGLNIGDKIIIEGVNKLSDGDSVSVSQDETDSMIKNMNELQNKNEPQP